MTPAPFPHRYSVSLADGRLSSPPRAAIDVGPPPQFGGDGRTWSPEELLVGAVLACLWTTFDAYARHDGLGVASWSGSGVAVLDKGRPVPAFTSITLTVALVVAPDDEDRARRLLATAEQHCIIASALRVPITLAVTVQSERAA